jgi:hypothetical protein
MLHMLHLLLILSPFPCNDLKSTPQSLRIPFVRCWLGAWVLTAGVLPLFLKNKEYA